MTRRKLKFISMLLPIICLALAACLDLKQPRTKIEYYTLEYDPPVPDHHPPLSEPIQVNQFVVSPIYNTNRIIYREGLFK